MTKNTEPKIGIFVDAQTGETIERQLNESELAYLSDLQKAEKTSQAEAKAKAETRLSALAKLAALGLTEAEIDAL